MYPPHVVAQIRTAVDPDGANKAAAAKRADPRQRRQMQPRSAVPVLANAQPPRLDMPAHPAQQPPQYLHSNGAVMPPRPPGPPVMSGMMPSAPALGTSFAGIRLQVCEGQGKIYAEICVQQGHPELTGSVCSLFLVTQCCISLCYHNLLSIVRSTSFEPDVCCFVVTAGSMRNRAWHPYQVTTRSPVPSVSLKSLVSLCIREFLTHGWGGSSEIGIEQLHLYCDSTKTAEADLRST